jgi:hypothetical protein
MKTLFYSDNVKSNSLLREFNIETLKEAGFIEGGLQSRSGEMYLGKLKTKYQIVFGMRCNIGGKQRKYFSLSKDYATELEAKEEFNELKMLMNHNLDKVNHLNELKRIANV